MKISIKKLLTYMKVYIKSRKIKGYRTKNKMKKVKVSCMKRADSLSVGK